MFTFFSIDLGFDIVYIFIDLFLLEGFTAFIRVILALLYEIEEELLQKEYDEGMVFLKTFGKHLNTDMDRFYAKAMSFYITKQMCRDLERYMPMLDDNYEIIFDQNRLKF